MNTTMIAGRSVRLTSRHHYERATFLALIAIVLVGLGALIGADGAGGTGALLVAIGLLVAWEVRGRLFAARRYRVGAIAEERVGSRLWALEDRGWLVFHDVQKGDGGNVDHLVHSPAVTFVIETKASCCRERDIEQARRHARWAAELYGKGREVIPVICVHRIEDRPRLVEGVYVLGAPQLVDFILNRG